MLATAANAPPASAWTHDVRRIAMAACASAPDRSDVAQPKAETFFPVFLATAVFAAGWTAVLQGSFVTTLARHDLADLPTGDMLRVGFLGA